MNTTPKEFPESKAGDILVAAERLFSRHGFDGVSINAVAQEAGVSKANVFHHFGSKDELYLAVLQHVRRELTRNLSHLTSEPDNDLGRNLARIAGLYLNHFFENEDRMRLFMREALEKRPGQSKAMAETVFSKDHAALTAVMLRARERGALDPNLNPNLPILMLMAACTLYFQWSELLIHFPGTEEWKSPDKFVDQVVDVLLHGIVTR